MLYWTGPFGIVPFAGNANNMIYAIPTDEPYAVSDTRSIDECGVPPSDAITLSDVTIATFDTTDLSALGDYTIIASDPEETLSSATIAKLASNFHTNKPINATRFVDVLFELWTEHVDGVNQRPIMPTVDGRMQFHLLTTLIDRPFDFGGPEWPLIQAELQRHYRELLKRGDDFHQRWLTVQLEKFKLPLNASEAERFIPSDLPKVDILPHFTTVTDNFNVADNATLSGQRTWTEQFGDTKTQSNQAKNVTGGADTYARCDSDLSSIDTSTTATVTAVGGYIGVAGRSAILTTEMMLGYFAGNGIGNQSVLSKILVGSRTDISSLTNGPASINDTITIDVNGSSHTVKLNGAAKVGPLTDTSISNSAYLRSGIFFYATGGDGSLALDDFIASDITAAALTNLRRIRPSLWQAVNRASTY